MKSHKNEPVEMPYNLSLIHIYRYKCKKQLYILDELMRNYKNAGFVVRIPEEWKEIQFGIHTNDVDILLNKVEVNSEDKQENEDE